MIVKANSARTLPAIGDSPESIGLFLYPPRDLSDRLSYDLRLVDRSRLGSGTSLPVLRDSVSSSASTISTPAASSPSMQ